MSWVNDIAHMDFPSSWTLVHSAVGQPLLPLNVKPCSLGVCRWNDDTHLPDLPQTSQHIEVFSKRYSNEISIHKNYAYAVELCPLLEDKILKVHKLRHEHWTYMTNCRNCEVILQIALQKNREFKMSVPMLSKPQSINVSQICYQKPNHG